ncbi:MAG: hypothetical protein MI866_06465, partial [Bacteroidales bacterium]|nr:hypothetical protein [Bacteroidales bacterium]
PDQVLEHSRVKDELSISLYVFLDGHLAFEQARIDTTMSSIKLDLPVSDSDRFLTLVVTDHNGEIQNAWCIFGEPSLRLR